MHDGKGSPHLCIATNWKQTFVVLEVGSLPHRHKPSDEAPGPPQTNLPAAIGATD